MNHEGYSDPTADKAIEKVFREQQAKTMKPIMSAQELKNKEAKMKLKRVTRIDSIPAGSTYFNEQGFLHDTPIVTSTGIFEYILPDGSVRRELRLPEHVFDKESLSSYEGKPVIISHDAGSIDKNNVMNEIVGTILSEGYQDDDNVRCKIVIHDIDKVKSIKDRELSLGYSLDLIEEPGEWNGEPYDAIQTNIRINHLAIVKNARAGDQAHLNLDGKKVELDDIENQEGGKKEMVNQTVNVDGYDMTPEELVEAIKMYKESKGAAPAEPTPAEPEVKDATEPVEEPVVEPTVEPMPVVEEPVVEEPTPQPEPVAEKKDGNVETLIATVKELLAAIEGGANPDCSKDGEPVVEPTQEPVAEPVVEPVAEPVPTKEEDSSDDLSQSMNNDSAEEIVKQRLAICRVGDKLNMDGLEGMSITEGKKAIIAKVLPDMRLDGKGEEYINAAYDMAVSKVNERKDVNYQRMQMTAQQRMDGQENLTSAEAARQRMLAREGGKQ